MVQGREKARRVRTSGVLLSGTMHSREESMLGTRRLPTVQDCIFKQRLLLESSFVPRNCLKARKCGVPISLCIMGAILTSAFGAMARSVKLRRYRVKVADAPFQLKTQRTY